MEHTITAEEIERKVKMEIALKRIIAICNTAFPSDGTRIDRIRSTAQHAVREES